jgi:hypothetical protein
VPLAVIGVVRSAHSEPETTPIQAALNRAGAGFTRRMARVQRGGPPGELSGGGLSGAGGSAGRGLGGLAAQP